MKILDVFTRSVDSVQLSLFMHPDQTQNTLSGIQGQEATAVAVVYVTAPQVVIYVTAPTMCLREICLVIKRAHWAFYWPKHACINLADIWTVNLLVHCTCLD